MPLHNQTTDTAHIRRALARCAREIDAINAMGKQMPLLPAWLTTLGVTDWQREQQLILAELPVGRWPHEWRNTALYPERFGWPCHAAGDGPNVLVMFFDGLTTVAKSECVRMRSSHGTQTLV